MTLAPILFIKLRVEVLVFFIEDFLREKEDYKRFSTYPLTARIDAPEQIETLI